MSVNQFVLADKKTVLQPGDRGYIIIEPGLPTLIAFVRIAEKLYWLLASGKKEDKMPAWSPVTNEAEALALISEFAEQNGLRVVDWQKHPHPPLAGRYIFGLASA
ncbi:MAG: hypothetical protein V4674_02550 [Patescibacteria group bacterium]